MRLWPVYVVLLLSLLVAPALAADTYLGFVSHQTTNTITVFDTNSNAVITTFSTDTSPRSIVVNPSGTLIYVPCVFSSTVDVYRSGDYTKVATITFPSSPYSIGTNAQGNKIYVADTTTKIYVIDAVSNTIIKTITSTATGYGQIYRYNDKLYLVKNTDGKVVVLDTVSDTILTYITVGTMPAGVVGNTNLGKIYVTNQGATTVSVINPTTDTVTATINVGANGPVYPCITSDGSKVYVPCYADDVLKVIDTSSDTVTATINTGNQPMGSAVEINNQYLYVANYLDNNITVISTSTNTVTGNINVSYASPEYMGIWKISAENSNPTPIQVTFSVASGVLIVTDANVSVYDAITNVFISSDNTDDAGNTIFWLIPGKRYNVTITGSDIVSNSQSVQVQPSKDQYTLYVATTGFSWNPFDWFNTNGTSTNGSRDSTKSITGAFAYSNIGTTGYMEAQYNDSTGQTIGIVFDLHKYNLTSEQYELIDTASVAANSGSHNFTILNAVNGTYRVYANGTNYLFSQGNISRMGEHYFRPTYGYDMGWPAYLYNFFDILILIIIGLTSVKRHALAGAVFMLFMSWVFVLIGWTSNLGVSALIIPVMLSVFTIIIFLYAAAKWRRETGV